ncbi:transcription termination factor NusA [bacterium]|nr:transcription termination factor NusA [bacterium]
MSKDKEIKIIIDAVSNEKDIDKEVVFEALEEALASAHQKHLDEPNAQIEVLIDRKTGEIHTARIWDVVDSEDDIMEPSLEINLHNALAIDPLSAVGLPNGAEAVLPRREMIPKETFRLNDRVRALIKEVVWEKKGPVIMLSRAHPQMLSQLFAIEVPEIGQGTIEIRAIARDPGMRAKVAVQAKDSRIEPKGACIGMRGSRINSVMEEVGGERIDIILWDENDAQFVVNALAPAEVKSIVVDEEMKLMQVVVEKEILSQAIGRNGQNVRLASELTGWKISVVSEEEASELQEAETNKILDIFSQKIGLDKELSEALIDSGFTDPHELAYVDSQEFLNMGFDEEIVNYVREKAQEYLLRPEKKVVITQDINTVPGMTVEWVTLFKNNNVETTDDLAELSTSDLLEIVNCTEEEAAALIMAARSRWFSDDAQ